MSDRAQQVVQECLELLGQGKDLEDCLALYPDDANEVEPLLRAAIAAQMHLAPNIPPAVRSRVRARVLEEWDQRQLRRTWRVPVFLPSLVPRWATIALLAVIVVAVGGGGTVAAAGGAVPGGALYPVKVLREEAQLWFARSPEAKVSLYTRLVKERVEELRTLSESKRPSPNAVSHAVGRLDDHLTALNEQVSETVERQESKSGLIDSDFLKTVDKTVQEQQAAQGLLEEALKEASADAQPGLRRAIAIIQEARGRVGAALEAVRSGSGK